jgi:pyruvate kinase
VESYLIPYVERASGLIVEEAGYTSSGALVAINLKLPAVVGASNAVEILKDLKEITLDANKGLVYLSKTRII